MKAPFNGRGVLQQKGVLHFQGRVNGIRMKQIRPGFRTMESVFPEK